MIKKINLVNKDASKLLEASINFTINKDNFCELYISIDNTINKVFLGSDYFVSLNKLRDWVYEWEYLYPMCKGSLINVYPSRMSRQMSKGIKAYNLTLGKQTKENDLIDIFDSVDISQTDNLSTVQEQKEYYINWIKSL